MFPGGLALGQGASAALGNAGPISSNDKFNFNFDTGPFGNRGPGVAGQAGLIALGAIVGAVILWLILR